MIFIVTMCVAFFLSLYSLFFPITESMNKLPLYKNIAIRVSMVCGVIVGTCLFQDFLCKAKTEKRFYWDVVYVSTILLAEIINFCMLWDAELWGWRDVVVSLYIIIIFFLEIVALVRVVFRQSLGKELAPTLLVAVAVIMYLIIVATERSEDIGSFSMVVKIVWCVIVFLLATGIYAKKYLFSPQKEDKSISHIIGVVFWGSAITISFPFFIRYCGLDAKSFDTFVTVYASLLGGGITLAGVAWTIRDTNNKRAEDERKRYIPYIKLVNVGSIPGDVGETVIVSQNSGCDYCNKNQRALFVDERVYKIHIPKFHIKNISNEHIIVAGLFLDDVEISVKGVILEKDKVCKIGGVRDVDKAFVLDMPSRPSKIRLLIFDMIGNRYYVESILSRDAGEYSSICEEDDGNKYTVISCRFEVKELSFPQLVK